MNNPLFTKQHIFSTFFALLTVLSSANSIAQQRYLGVTLVNEGDNPHLEYIDQAKTVGCNAVLLTIQWGSIEGKLSRVLKQENGETYNVWKQYDDQIAHARSLGMKVAINVAISTSDDVTHSLSDRYGIDTGDGWKKDDRILNVNYGNQEAVFQKYGGLMRPKLHVQFVMTSLAAQATRDRLVNFTSKVINRYKYLQEANDLLYVDVICTRTGEGEFEIGTSKFDYEQEMDMSYSSTDYSKPMVSGYKSWLAHKYGNVGTLNSTWGTNFSSFDAVAPKRPSGSMFAGKDGSDWYLYRSSVLKEINTLFKNTVKGINSNIKVILHHGSVFDKLSRGRGTFAFNEVGAELDGIKINNDTYYDHRFSIDLLRSNLPGKLYVNETAFNAGIENTIRLARESYTHGAQIVTIFMLSEAMKSPSDIAALQAFSNEWVKNKQVTSPAPSNHDSFTLSSMINNDGCTTNRDDYGNDCDAYKKWRTAYANAGNQPVNILLTNDLQTSPLPVTLVDFSAKKQEQAVALNWQTSAETNSDHFAIQHSIDGKQWEEIGQVQSNKESTTLKRYTYTDEKPASAENLYRLKMQDLDGSFAYSRIVSVRFENKNELVVYPNPASASSIQLQYSGSVPDITLTDINGRTISTSTERTDADKLILKPKSKLVPGQYVVTAGYGIELVRYKLVVIN